MFLGRGLPFKAALIKKGLRRAIWEVEVGYDNSTFKAALIKKGLRLYLVSLCDKPQQVLSKPP